MIVSAHSISTRSWLTRGLVSLVPGLRGTRLDARRIGSLTSWSVNLINHIYSVAKHQLLKTFWLFDVYRISSNKGRGYYYFYMLERSGYYSRAATITYWACTRVRAAIIVASSCMYVACLCARISVPRDDVMNKIKRSYSSRAASIPLMLRVCVCGVYSRAAFIRGNTVYVCVLKLCRRVWHK